MPRKQPSQFCKNGHDKTITGVVENGRCKVCREESRKARYQANRESILQASKDWYQEHREDVLEEKRLARLEDPNKFREQERARYWKNPDKFRQEGREYYQENREEILAKSKEYNKRPDVKEVKSIYNHEHWHLNKERLKPKKAAARLLYKERAREVSRLWREANKESISDYNRVYGQDPEVKERRRAREKANRQSNPARHKAKKANRRKAEGKLSVQDVRDVYDMCDGICCLCLNKLKEGDTHLEHTVPIARNGTNWPSNVLLAHSDCNISKSDSTPLEYLLGWPKVTSKYNMSELNGRNK
jgi:5-methylcytosine-specific restriction endonuclease McrA